MSDHKDPVVEGKPCPILHDPDDMFLAKYKAGVVGCELTECMKARKKEYRQKPEVKAKQKEYYQKHVEEIKVMQKEYRQKHADEIKAKRKEYYQKHADELKARQKEYYQKHKKVKKG